MTRAYLGLGTNLGDRAANLRRAVAGLEGAGVRVTGRSRVCETEPWGITTQPWFLNAVVGVETDLGARGLLACCLRVEESMGRVRRVRWGPRIIDIDLLLFGDRTVIEPPELIVPHPRLHQRAFVLGPLADLDPEAVVPGLGPVPDLLKAVRDMPGQTLVWRADAL